MRQLFRSLATELSLKWPRRVERRQQMRELNDAQTEATPRRVQPPREQRAPYKPKPPSISEITSHL